MTEPLDRLVERVRAAVEPLDEVVGVATVDLEVAAAALAPGVPAEPLPDDQLLGARCALVRPEGDAPVVILEPSTEGRLAATLARHGEGPAVRYVIAGPGSAGALARAGLPLSVASRGPLGRTRLVLGGPRWGPHVALVEVAG